jgi:1-deoxy-D-xylulose-5-phosphate synthase
MHPVVCVYATFLNRAFDQLLMDCALHRAGVTFVLDRAGITGTDGASHNGMWDMSITGLVPGLRLTAPRDPDELGRALREAVDVHDGPTVIRFSKQNPPAPLPAVRSVGSVDVLSEASTGAVELLLVGLGEMATTGMAVAEKLTAQGHSVRVVDPRWCVPVPDDLVDLARSARAVAVLEDNVVVGGVGSQVTAAVRDAGLSVPVHLHGIPKRFLPHASRGEVLEEIGLTPDAIADRLHAALV